MPGLESTALGVFLGLGRVPTRGARAERDRAFPGTHGLQGHETAQRAADRREIEDVGGYINAYTSREVTAYYARVLRDDVALALDLISDIVLNPVFDPREIEVERGVILQGDRAGRRHAR